jgi:hypothetical protein
MDQRPLTFGDLVQRLTATPRGPNIRSSRPIVASLVPRDIPAWHDARPTWAILANISDWNVQLIHPHPLRHKQFEMEITASGGEMLRCVVRVGRSACSGDLYQTPAAISLNARTHSPFFRMA